MFLFLELGLGLGLGQLCSSAPALSRASAAQLEKPTEHMLCCKKACMDEGIWKSADTVQWEEKPSQDNVPASTTSAEAV